MPTRKRRRFPASAVRTAFKPYAVGPESEDGEQRMYCPLCEDASSSASPSASINAEEGVWNCLKGDHGGQVTDLVAEMKRRKAGFAVRAQPTASAPRERAAPKLTPLDNQDKPIQWHDRMMLAHPERLDYLHEQRQLTDETLVRFRIGWDGERYTIPVRVRGKYVNIRRYSPGAKSKMLNLDGHGSAVLAFTEVLNGNTLPVLLCEGEFDSILANQESAGHYVAVTGTGGAPNPPRDLTALANREVFIAYDCDDTGVAGAAKIADRLREVGATVHVIDLTKLGLPYADKHGADISDYFCKFGGTADKLAEEFDRLRDDDPADHDEVYAAIEALFNAEDEHRTTLITEARSDDDILEMKPARYVIDGWLPVGFFSDFFGEPGSKKSFVLLDMLRHIRAGIDWHGHAVAQGATLLFEGEGLEQLQTRILAWNEHHGSPALAPGASFDTSVNITTPGGVAAVARTVRDYERKHDTSVVAVAFDPLVEFMTGEEVGDGMEQATRGLRALARYLDIAVVVGAHTNASGERARGSDHLRMRSGAHVKVEALSNGVDLVGLVQEKQKNGERRALQLMPVPVGPSLALNEYRRMSAAEYYADKSGAASREQAVGKIKVSVEAAAAKFAKADELLTEHVRANPGIGKGKLSGACTGQGVGKDVLESRIDALVKDGVLRVEKDGPRVNSPSHYYVADPTESA